MLKEQFEKLSNDQKALISVSYLLENPDLQPEEAKKLFAKMANYDKNAHSVQEAMNEARKALAELKPQLDQIIGAMTALSSVVAEYVPAEKYEEYCLAYELPQDLSRKLQNQKPVSNSIDIAGSTSKNLPGV